MGKTLTTQPFQVLKLYKVNMNLNESILRRFINDYVLYLGHGFKYQPIPMIFKVPNTIWIV